MKSGTQIFYSFDRANRLYRYRMDVDRFRRSRGPWVPALEQLVGATMRATRVRRHGWTSRMVRYSMSAQYIKALVIPFLERLVFR